MSIAFELHVRIQAFDRVPSMEVPRMVRAVTGARVALADDVPGMRKVMIRLLETLGHKVICAVSNGAELVDACAGKRVDVVCTDFDMPVMDGLAAAQELAERGIPVVLVTGHSDADEIVLDREPIVVCVWKPVEMETLQSAIEQALRGREGNLP
jgi:CheY-like chemotaxis protein